MSLKFIINTPFGHLSTMCYTILTVHHASLAPKKAVDFLSDKPIEIELEGALLALDGETAPFYVDRPETV